MPRYPAGVQQATREHVALVGDGQMALVLSDILAVRGITTTLISPFAAVSEKLAAARTSPRLPGFTLPAQLRVTSDASMLADATLVVCAIPTQYIGATFAAMAPWIAPGVPVVSIAKGLLER